MKLYLDNAATSYPKPSTVYSAVMNYMMNIGANPGRGGYSSALEGNRIIYDTREALIDFFSFDKLENVIFTPNVTYALNLLLKAVLRKGDHAITTAMDHNSVLRPLHTLKQRGLIELDILSCSKEGLLDTTTFLKAIKPNTKVMVMTHASNIIGTLQPIEEIGKLCRKNNIFFILDTAQTAGSVHLNFHEVSCNALAFTGHKGLLGPQGIGGFIIDDAFNEASDSFIEGGTGSLSDSMLQPTFLPDKYESGTSNTPAIAGLLEGIHYIQREGISSIKEKEQKLCEFFLEGLSTINNVEIYGPMKASLQTATVSFNVKNMDNAELGFLLDRDFGIMTRTGLHCAPLAHKTIGTYPQGALRVSFGPFNDLIDVDYTLSSINQIVKRK